MSSIGYSNIAVSEIDALIPSANNKVSEFYTSPELRFRGLDRADPGANWFQANSNFRTGLKKLSDFAGYYKFEGMRYGYLYNFHALTSLGKTIGPPGTNWRPPNSAAELQEIFNYTMAIPPDVYHPSYMGAQGTYEEGGYPRNDPKNAYGERVDVSWYTSGYSYYESEYYTSGVYIPKTLNLILAGVRHHSAGTDGNRGIEGRFWCSQEKDLTNAYSFHAIYESDIIYPNSVFLRYAVKDNRKNDGCSLKLVNNNYSDLMAWQKGDTITIESLIYNIEKTPSGTTLYLVQNYAGTKYTDGTDIPFYNGDANGWDNSDPKMCAYFNQNDIAIYTNHF